MLSEPLLSLGQAVKTSVLFFNVTNILNISVFQLRGIAHSLPHFNSRSWEKLPGGQHVKLQKWWRCLYGNSDRYTQVCVLHRLGHPVLHCFLHREVAQETPRRKTAPNEQYHPMGAENRTGFLYAMWRTHRIQRQPLLRLRPSFLESLQKEPVDKQCQT